MASGGYGIRADESRGLVGALDDGSRSPVGAALLTAERRNERLGHENLGSLSGRRGFLPTSAPRSELPATHGLWDQLATELPQLHRDMHVRAALDHMPELSARPEALPDAVLLRAATVLGIFGHAYYYVSPEAPSRLPDGVARPWAEVLRRLGRPTVPVLSYADLIVNNWRLVDPRSPDRLELDNLRLLVPTVDNREEHVFYLTQVEILARSAPLLPAAARAQEAVLNDDADMLRDALGVMSDVLREVTRRALPRIDPRPGSASYVDPVVWAKTVAPFAVPFRHGVLGPSGTASPMFNLLDAFLQRTRHDSQLGREILLHRAGYPAGWQSLLRATGEVSVPAYVAGCRKPELCRALDDVREAYAGDDGFLGRHRRKVFGYLEIGFKVGRGVTIAGFIGQPADRTWEQVDDALEHSRGERDACGGTSSTDLASADGRASADGQASADRQTSADDRASADRRASADGQVSSTNPPLLLVTHEPGPPVSRPSLSITVSELTRHNSADHGWWVAVHGRVHDVTPLLRRHPGGQHVLRAHAGLDATQAFDRAHSGRAAAERLRRAVDIGRLCHPDLPRTLLDEQHSLRRLYNAWVHALFLAVETQNALRLDWSFSHQSELDEPFRRSPTSYELARDEDTYRRYHDTYLPRLCHEVLQPLVTVLLAGEASPRDGVDEPACSVRPEADAVLEGLEAGSRDDASRLDDRLGRLVGMLRRGVTCLEKTAQPRVLLTELARATRRLESELSQSSLAPVR